MKLFAISILSFLSLSLFSQTINFETAEVLASHFREEQKTKFDIEGTYRLNKAKSYSYSESGNDYYHIINFQPKGFVIVSADKRVAPILGYSYESSCPKGSQSPEFNWWMKQCVDQIKFIEDKNLESDRYVDELWAYYLNEMPEINTFKSINSLDPMLTTTWNQSPYYNSMCPADPAGPMGNCLSGCVATALGQLMNYYRHPQQGVGSYSYDHPTYGTQAVDFSSQTYNWDKMGTDLTDENPEIAKLLYHIGVSVDMNYGPSGSGMYNHKGAYTLHTYFDYAEDTRYYFRDSLNPNFNWKDTLRMQLDNGMPTYYAGWGDTIFQSGHAFIVDGYQDSSFFHFNWGWGGSSDGYFNIDNLTPSGSNFTLLHEMIAYSFPKNNYPNNCAGAKTLTSTRGTIDDGSGPLNNYANNQNCTWLIAPIDSISSISLDFLKFELETNDVLTIYDGVDDSAPVIGVYTGASPPAAMNLLTDRLFLSFSSDASTTAPGFLVEYITEKPTFCTASNTYLTEATGTFHDGSNGYDYENGSTCRWRIKPTGATSILITFDYLETEPDLDYIIIRDMTNWINIDTISGHQLPDPILVYTDDVRIFWKTSYESEDNGWQITYESNTVSIPEKNQLNKFKIYPNPANENVTITIDHNLIAYTINLRDISGRIIYTENTNTRSNTIDISQVSKGLYFVELVNSDERWLKKLLIN